MTGGPSLRRNLLWKLGATAGEKSLRLGFVVAATRVLGDVSWGQLAYASATTALFAQLADLGTALFVARETAAAREVDAGLVGGVAQIRLRLGLGYIATIGLVAAVHHDEPEMAVALLFTGTTWLLQSSLEFVWHIFRGLESLRVEARLQMVQALLQTGLGGGVLVAVASGALGRGWTANGLFMLAMLLGNAFTIGVAIGQLRGVLRPRRGLDAALWQRFRGEVLPLGVAIVASLVYYKIDVPMLRNMAGDAATGQYAAAYRLLEMAAILPSIVMAATFPALARTLITDPGAATTLHRRARFAMLGVGCAVGGVFALVPEWVVAILYGAEFAPAALVLRPLGVAVVLTFVNYVETHMLVALGLVRWQMGVALSLCGFNVIANWFAIPRYGAAGAAWTTAATETLLLAAVAPVVSRAMRTRSAA